MATLENEQRKLLIEKQIQDKKDKDEKEKQERIRIKV